MIKQINYMFPAPPVHTEKEQRNREQKIVSRYATGNLSLQRGLYITRKDIERRKSDLITYNFVSKDYS